MKKILAFASIALIVVACKKNKEESPITQPPVVMNVTPAIGQTGDTVTIEGTNFSSQLLENEVAINGIPAEVTHASSGQIKAVIPAFCTSGKLMITSRNTSAEGPVLTVIQAPVIREIFPVYGFPGDILTIRGKHFAKNDNDNHIEINGVNTPVVERQADTLLRIVVPEGNGSGVLFFHTYDGRKKEHTQIYQLRKPYTGTILNAIATDPAFTYANAVLERMKEIYPQWYNKLAAIWDGSAPCTVFLKDNIELTKQYRAFTSVDYVRKNADPQLFYFIYLMSTTNQNILKADFSNQEYPSMLSEDESWGEGQGGRPDYFIPFMLINTPDGHYYSLYDNPVRIIKTDLRATNGTIHQIE